MKNCNLFLKVGLMFLTLIFWKSGWGQTTIFSENFDSGSSPFGFNSITGGSSYSGNSSSSDLPASSPFFVSSNVGYGVSNGNAILTTSDINTSSYVNIVFELRLAAFSINSSGNGVDAPDIVTIEISPNGGSNWYSTIRVLGNSNAYWSYSGGTGNASTAYDGNSTPFDYATGGGGNRTTDGYSTMTITALPTTTNLRVRITQLNSSANERWVIDDVKITGDAPTPSSITHTGTSPVSTNILQGSTNNILYQVKVDVSTAAATLNSLVATTGGDWATADISNFKLWYSTDATFSSGSDLLLKTLTSYPGGTSDITFSGLSQSIPIGTKYLFITCDVASGATPGKTVSLGPDSDSDFTYSVTPTYTGSTFATPNAMTIVGIPEIQLQYPIATNVACGFTLPFGSVSIGSNSSLTVRIKNLGAADLTFSLSSITGSGAADYSIITSPSSPIAPGGSSDMVIQFAPSATGSRPAAITISSNDSDEASCGITISGTGLLANDNCSGATSLTVYSTPTCGGSTSGTTVGATSSGVTGCAGTADDDVWYTFVATSTSHTITVVGTSPLDAVVDLRSGAACNGTNIACADATAGGGTEVINATGLTIGATYLIRIYGWGSGGSSQGTFTVCVSTPAPPSITHTGTSSASSNIQQSSTNNLLYSTQVTVTSLAATLSQVIATTNGTWVAGDVSNFKLWFSTDANFGGDATIATANSPSPGNITFNVANQAFPIGTSYLFITCDIAANAGINNTVGAGTDEDADYTYSPTPNFSGSTFSSVNLKTIIGIPEIQLEYPIGTNVSCGFSLSFGSVTIGSSTSLTIRIRNAGTADLNLTSLPFGNSGDYSVTTQPTSPIPAGSYSDVIIQFTPTAAGTRTGSISIANNDNTGSENPCGISMTGVGLLVNDNCSGAISLAVSPTPNCSVATSGTTVGATFSGVGAISCNGFTGNDDDDVWYSFVATSTTHTITVDDAGSLDAVVDLRSGACPGTNINCADSPTAGATEILNATGLTIGATYLIRIYGYGSGTGYGTFTVCVTTPSPEIQLKESGTTNRACGYTYNMGTVNVGSTASLTVRIQNTATINGVSLNLTNLPLTLSGANASEFSITTQPTSPIAYNNAFSDVVIQFAPTSNGQKTASISIDNNDSDENPCSINLSGTGFQALYFQSKQSGQWSSPTTWESSSVSVNGPWSNATAAPTTSDLEVKISPSHTVTISSGSVSADQLTISANSMLDILSSGSLIIADGVGTDLTVNGILKNAGNITTTGTLVVADGGIYQHNWTTDYGVIPTATWSTGSTCEILGYTSPPAGTIQTTTGMYQNFSNFSWNTPSLSTAPNLAGNTITATGTFYMVSTGSSELRLGTGSNGTINTVHFSQSGGTINCAAGNGSGRIKVSGNFEQSGGTITETSSGNGTIEITGAANITVTGGSILNSINFLINCPSKVARLLNDFTLVSPTTLSLSDGKLNLNGYELQVATILGTPAWGGTTTSYIIAESGNLRQTTATNTLFPVGTSNLYTPCRLTGTGDYKVNISATTSGLTDPSLALPYQWNITSVAGGSVGMGFQWPSSIFGTNVYLYKHNGSNWSNVAGPVIAAGSGPYTASFGSINCCSGFTVGGLSALPVELAYFRPTPVSGKVQLDWRTYSEINNSHFLIEKSRDGIRFREIGKKDGQGTTLETTDYQFIDEEPNAGINYYRLKQMDFDGIYEYSNIVSVTFNDRKGQLQLFPSLATDEVYLHFPVPTESIGSLQVIDLTGQMLMEVRLEAGTEDMTLPIADLRSGHYFVQVKNGQLFESWRFVKQ